MFKRSKGAYSEADLKVTAPEDAGPTAVAVSTKRSLEHMALKRTAQTLLRLNHAEGFDCMSCAWQDPDPGHRHAAEFCENGAKAVAEEATRDRATPELFAQHSLDDLGARTEYWLGQQGRITHPMVQRPGGTHYEPIEWDQAFELIGAELRSPASPDEATFCTSGRASNESAFAYDDRIRRVHGFRVVSYDTPRGSAAAYYPETNPLVPLDSAAIASNCPTSTSVVATLSPAVLDEGPVSVEPVGDAGGSSQAPTGADWCHEPDPQPHHLS